MIQSAIDGLTPSGGNDWEESVYSALMHSIDGNSLGTWRSDSNIKKIIILMGDAPPHDPEPNTDYTRITVTDAANSKNISIYSILTGGGVGNATATSYFNSLAINTGGVLIEAPDGSTASEAVIQAIDLATTASVSVYTENGCVLNYWNSVTGWDDVSSNNIHEDPNFVLGYYLSRISAGQDVNSFCIDRGGLTAIAARLENYTTQTDGVFDANMVDMGYHYKTGATYYQLTIDANTAMGSVATWPLPSSHNGKYLRGTVAQLTATPNYGYKVKKWTGTDDDLLKDPNNTVTMSEDKTVTVEFEAIPTYTLTASVNDTSMGSITPLSGTYPEGTVVELTVTPANGYCLVSWSGTSNNSSFSTVNYVTMNGNKTVSVLLRPQRVLTVPVDYPSLQAAIEGAGNGDKIILSQGTYYGQQANYDYSRITINGKNVTITGTNPADPCTVAKTIIQANGFDIQNVDRSTIIDGITIQDAHYFPGSLDCGADYAHDPNSGDGINGLSIDGGAIKIVNASPTIRNCRFVRCSALAENACDGEGDYGDGGWAGWARGGAVGIYNGSPIFKNCDFIDCWVRGSNGGDATGRWGHGGSWGDPNGGVWGQVWDFGPYEEYWRYSGYGGAVYCDPNSNSEFEGCLFQGNRAYGGVCGISGSDMSFGYPMEHYAIDSFGGAAYVDAGSETSFTDCIFIDNEAYAYGQISGSDAPDYNNPDIGVLYDSTISYGGALCAENSAKPVLKNCEFINNRACAGGAIYWENISSRISSSGFYDGQAMLGGGILLINSDSILFDCDFVNNTAISPDAAGGRGGQGQGGGAYVTSGSTKFYDCSFAGNRAYTSGGAAYFSGTFEPNMHNCLIRNNTADIDGGGISANWNTKLSLSNCTITSNTTPAGSSFSTGLGGGVSCAYEASVDIINSIIWNNNAEYGKSIAIGSPFSAADKYPATVSVSYSDVRNAQTGTFVDTASGCKLLWGSGNLPGTSLDSPLFINGYWGNCYLSQPTGQTTTSPCVDSGFGLAADSNLFRHTTRTDHSTKFALAIDNGNTDMGFHYLLNSDLPGDLNYDGQVDMSDLWIFAHDWLFENCTFPYFCHGSDLTEDGNVNFEDFALFAEYWNKEETTPPTPDPMTWQILPRSAGLNEITMRATTAKDYSGSPVEYRFCRENYDGSIAYLGWFSDPNFTDTGLTFKTLYGYKVQARDARGNETGWSFPKVYAVPGEDWTPPEPNQMTWAIMPYPTSPNSIAMIATTAIDDPCGVQYYFYELSGNPGGNDSGWQDSPIYEDFDLEPNAVYEYKVKARDKTINQNETLASISVRVRMDYTAPDQTYPVYTPTVNGLWFVTPYAVAYDGVHWEHYMVAVAATDDDNPPVSYWFECAGSGIDSGWFTPADSSQPVIYSTSQFYYFTTSNPSSYRVHIKDDVGNELISSWWNTRDGLVQ
ncbi:MAG: hypothetical protein PHP01_05470 [Phycisphaerae bacterium]|nr:hypothetical protein [Phycisphaerae bacterium]